MRILVGGALVLLLLCSITQAQTINWMFPLDGLQEVPPVATPATGTGDVTLDTATNELTWTVHYQDLIGAISAAHFHGPAAPGVNAGIQVGSTIGPSPLTGGPVVLTQTQADDLINGLWYFNIHSSFAPGGEIRGQVVPEPAALGALGALALLLLRKRRGRE